jgi:antitoxin MazE
MRTRIQRWGNSLAMRIPHTVAVEMQMGRDTWVDLTMAEGRLVVTPVAEDDELTLTALLANVTEQNLHVEVETGPAVGAETW